MDPLATGPYLFHLAAVSVSRQADPAFPSLARAEVLEHRLVGLRQYEDGTIESCPVEHLLLLRGGERYPRGFGFVGGPGWPSGRLGR